MTKTYKFNDNLLKLSKSTLLEDAKKEWYLIETCKTESYENICICQHKVKHLNYMYNIITKHTIICGYVCSKKFNLDKIKIKNKILLNILKIQIYGEYAIIDNILIYSDTVKNKLILYFTEEINKNNDILKLKQHLDDIDDLINNYNIEYLEDIKQTIIEKQIELDRLKEKEWFEELKRHKEIEK
jgi:hypothetical protein